MKAKYRYLSHTADMEFVGYGRSLEEAIENSALAMLNIMIDLKRVKLAKGRILGKKLSESAGTVEGLVWFTLQDILSKVDAGYLKAYGFKVNRLDADGRFLLEGTILHKKLEGDYSLLGVKAVTAHGLVVKKGRSGYSVHAVVDV